MGLTSEQMRTVVVLLAGTLLVVLNQTLLSPALPVIMGDMNVDATTVQWLTSGYSLVEAIIIPLSAYLMGRFSTRQLFIGGLCIFTAGTVLAACAPMFIFLLLGRMLQASATGFVMPMVFTVILLIFPRERRGSAMGIVSLVIGFAPAVGPSVSGVLVETIGWRALFVVVAVIAAAVIVASFFVLRNHGDFERTTFDKASVLLSSFGLLSLLYGLSSITSSDNVVLNLVLIAVGAVLVFFFVRRQGKLPVPFLRVQVLKTRNYRTTVTIVACFQAGLVGTGVLLPIFLQNLLGATPLQTGLIMLPGAVIGAITAMMAGRLFDKFGVRKLTVPGTFVACVGAVGLVSFNLGTPLLFVVCVYTLLALGLEFTMTPLNTWGINSLDNRVIQHANATANTINQISASLGTAILVSLSATSTFLYPDLPAAEQQMAGIHISFCFTAIMLVVIFVMVLAMVRDRKTEPSAQASYVMEGAPAEDGEVITVGMMMNDEPYSITDESTIRDVAQILASSKTSGLPVVDGSNSVVGFISDGDIMKYIGRSDVTVLDPTNMLYQMPDNEGLALRVSKLLDLNVMKIATANAICVNVETPLEDACKLLAEKRLKKVPVVMGDEHRLVGSLSRSDIIRSTMENLAEIELRAADERKGYDEEVV